ncbi:hypothetical protein P3T76_014095 [Phytophthora citrophthora]|uniref:Uncharacterized protein n=1 Tax=Phytophthora citrophthora TaxID=4793 RepID=A0AAD9G1U5_9STRA|nr:hypothetical protein P3T76_014095 [Phytophthora citrophthora]
MPPAPHPEDYLPCLRHSHVVSHGLEEVARCAVHRARSSKVPRGTDWADAAVGETCYGANRAENLTPTSGVAECSREQESHGHRPLRTPHSPPRSLRPRKASDPGRASVTLSGVRWQVSCRHGLQPGYP